MIFTGSDFEWLDGEDYILVFRSCGGRERERPALQVQTLSQALS
jgi:hypothetical protein